MINKNQTEKRKYKGKLEYKGEPKTSFVLNPTNFIEPSQIINKFTYSLQSQNGEILYNFIADTEEEVDKRIKVAEPIMDLIETIEWTRFKTEQERLKAITCYQLIRELEGETKQLQRKLRNSLEENKFALTVEMGTIANTYILEDIK